MKKILIIGSINDNHIIRLIKHIKLYDSFNTLRIDGFNFVQCLNNGNDYINNYFYNQKHFWSILYKIPLIRTICDYIDITLSFKKIKETYDIYNFQYPNIYTAFLRKFIKKESIIIVSPWGSDVYRLNKSHYKIIKRLYDRANIITVPPIKFRKDIQNLFHVDDSKIRDLGFGSEIIDEIIDSTVDKVEAKNKLRFTNKYIITCGYNGVPDQNHIEIIEALESIKKILPKDLILVIPLTYGTHDKNYIFNLKKKLEYSGFEYYTYESFLDNETITNIRIATDVFIHIQKSDAYSATVQEFLLTDSVVFNGNWLRYPNLEVNGIPYHLVNSIKELKISLASYFKNKNDIMISEECKETIRKTSWKHKGKDWYTFLAAYEPKF